MQKIPAHVTNITDRANAPKNAKLQARNPAKTLTDLPEIRRMLRLLAARKLHLRHTYTGIAVIHLRLRSIDVTTEPEYISTSVFGSLIILVRTSGMPDTESSPPAAGTNIAGISSRI